jgi:hypothetical protein
MERTINCGKITADEFEIGTAKKDWLDGDIISYRYQSPGVSGGVVLGNKVIPVSGEDYLEIPPEVTAKMSDAYFVFKDLINDSTVGGRIAISNKDINLNKFIDRSAWSGVDKSKLQFLLIFEKLGNPGNVFLHVRSSKKDSWRDVWVADGRYEVRPGAMRRPHDERAIVNNISKITSFTEEVTNLIT